MVIGNNFMSSPLRILFVEDSEHDVTAFRRALAKGGVTAEITCFVRAEDALPTLDEIPLPFDLLVADYKLPGMTGLELCKHVIAREISLPSIMITGAGTEKIAVEALKAGVNDYLVKDFQQTYLEILPLLLPEVIRRYRDRQIALIYNRERNVIASIAEMFLSPENGEALCRKFSETLALGLAFPVAVVMLLAKNKEELIVKGISGLPDTTLLEKRVPLEQTLCIQTIVQGLPVFKADIGADPNLDCFLRDYGINTCLSVAIKGKKSGIMGALILADFKKRPDADIHIFALQDIAHHLGQEIERKRIEDELRLHSAIINNMMEGVLLVQASTLQIVYANPVIEKIFAFEPGELLGRHISVTHALSTARSPAETVTMIHERLLDNGYWQGEIESRKKDCTPFWCSVTISGFDHPVFGHVWISIQTDITDKKKAYDALKKSRQEWAATFDAMADIITIQDKDMRIVRANKAAHDFFQAEYGELNGKTCYEIFTGTSKPCPGCPLLETLQDRSCHSALIRHDNLRKIFQVSSTFIPADTGGIQYLVHIAKDVTEQKRLEEELCQAHKMEAIGTLAGGVAHDFNNMLAAIIGFSELARKELKEGSHAARDIDEVLRAAQRAAGVVRQILTFSRKGPYKREKLQPHLIVKEALRLMRASLPTTLELQEDIDTNSGFILADLTQIHQIVVNLCTNALHALEEETGVVKVTLLRRELDADDVFGHSRMSPGPFIELSVSDTGCGMDKQTAERIFEPYFTTKDIGKGSGLGLAVVLGIVENCGGMITVESELGKGSTFHLYFPAIVEEARTSEEAKEESLPTGTERILIVDDEDSIVALHQTVLSRLGYTVTTKTSSAETLAVFKDDPQRFDLLITDQSMPVLSGAKLAQEVLSIRPDLPIILCTGYSETLSEEGAIKIGIKKYLLKPVERKELARTVRMVLDQQKKM